MKILLTIYCGVWIGLVITTFLYSTRFSLLNTTHNTPFSTDPLFSNVDEITPYKKHNNCFETVIKCPSIGPCHCSTICGSRFKERTIEEDSEVIYLNQKLDSGNYCLPDNIDDCPRLYGITVFDSNGKSSCVCKYPSIFGGQLCNQKQVCHKGVLINNKTHMPINELDLKDDHYYCKCFKDKRGNMMIHLPGDRLNCVSDPCLAFMVTAPEHIGLTPEGLCHCGDYKDTRVQNMYLNDLTSPCTSCHVKWTSNGQAVVSPLRCLSIKGSMGYAPPCKDFTTHYSQCEQLAPMRMEITGSLYMG